MGLGLNLGQRAAMLGLAGGHGWATLCMTAACLGASTTFFFFFFTEPCGASQRCKSAQREKGEPAACGKIEFLCVLASPVNAATVCVDVKLGFFSFCVH